MAAEPAVGHTLCRELLRLGHARDRKCLRFTHTHPSQPFGLSRKGGWYLPWLVPRANRLCVGCSICGRERESKCGWNTVVGWDTCSMQAIERPIPFKGAGVLSALCTPHEFKGSLFFANAPSMISVVHRCIWLQRAHARPPSVWLKCHGAEKWG